ncbi:MAG: hypothetical protein ACI4TM_11610 [Candidatus Cryptobacteroides sp.]
MENKEKHLNGWKVFKRVLLWGAGVWAVLLLILQIVLSDSVLTKIVNSLADGFITEDVDFGRVSASVIKNFPNLNVTVEDVCLTYPHDKFAACDTTLFHGRLMDMGRSPEKDTLISVRSLSASVNIGALIFNKIKVPHLILEKPRIFAKTYGDSLSNWNVLKTESQDDTVEDTSAFTMPFISVGKVALTGNPSIVFCNARDTLCASIRLKEALLKGRMSTEKGASGRLGLAVDSLKVAGRLASDTLMLSLPSIKIAEQSGIIDLQASAMASAATRGFGRIGIPVEISSRMEILRDSVPGLNLTGTSVSVANIPLCSECEIRYYGDSLYVKGEATIDGCKVADVLKYFNNSKLTILKDIRTDAVIDLSSRFGGWYRFSGGRTPGLDLLVSIPSSALTLKGSDFKGRLALEAEMNCSETGVLDVCVTEAAADVFGARVSLEGAASDLLGDDPVFLFKTDVAADLDSLAATFLKEYGVRAGGKVEAGLGGLISMSQIDLYRFAEADLDGFVKSLEMNVSMPSDTVSLHVGNLDVSLSTSGNISSESMDKGGRMLSLKASLDTLSADVGGALMVRGSSLKLDAWNDAAILAKAGGDDSVIHPLSGHLTARRLSLRESDSYAVFVGRTDNVFTLAPQKDDRSVPTLELNSSNGRIMIRDSYNRLSFSDLVFKADAVNIKKSRQIRMAAMKDSLSRIYPDVPSDSLMRYAFSRRKSSEMEDWMTEKDFAAKDIKISLGETVTRYYREWKFNGDLDFGRASVVTPYFPLKITFGNFCGKVSNNEVDIESFSLTAGSSSISAKGQLSGLRRSILRNGVMDMKLDVKSDSLNVNELLAAMAKGGEFAESHPADGLSESIDDDDYEKLVVTDTLADVKAGNSLIVIPSNINAEINLSARNVDYSTLRLHKAQSEIAMRERCLRLTKTFAVSDIGNLYFNGFYSTRTKKDLKAGFALSMEGITAEKVIEMIPAVDSILPMLKSFKGNLDCDLAATASIDTNMNVIMPTIDGVMKIHGSKLSVEKSEAFTKIANLLKFNNSATGYIDEMSVEGLISDNSLEIFPFVVDIDRYKLALSGVQNMDQSFRYHISIIESPMVFKFGVDLYGDNFNDFKFKIGKALYKSGKVPVFTAVVDQTKVNLTESIKNVFRKGVDEAIRENNRHELINRQKAASDYSADAQMDSLSTNEMTGIDNVAAPSEPSDTLPKSVIPVGRRQR